jgi:hypothetical protein
MSIKSKVLAASATLTLVGGMGAAGALTAGTASAATPSCGSSCINVFTNQFGTHRSPNFVVDVLRQGEKAGQPVILFRTANYDPAEDFTVAFQGTVRDFYNANLVSSELALHYGNLHHNDFPNLPAFEQEYAPFGVDSGLCLGVATGGTAGEGVTLQPCGVSANTVWIVDTEDSWSHFGHDEYLPLINGSDTNFSHPLVLTYPTNAFPTDMPRPQLTVTNLTGSAQGIGGPEIGTINSNQLWGADFGVLGSPHVAP